MADIPEVIVSSLNIYQTHKLEFRDYGLEFFDNFNESGLETSLTLLETQIEEGLRQVYTEQALLLDDELSNTELALITVFIANQLDFLRKLFSRENISRYSPRQMANWLSTYANTGRYYFEFIQRIRFGIPALPGYPGVGTLCALNCGCYWEHIFDNLGWERSIWRLTQIEHCQTCLTRAASWTIVRVIEI